MPAKKQPTSLMSALLRRIFTAAAAILFCATLAQAQTVVALVNGEPITNLDIEQRTKLNALATHKMASRDDTLKELIDEKVKIKEAKKFGMDMTTSEVDEAYAGMGQRMHVSADQLTKLLAQAGVRPDTLRSRLKAEAMWGQLVRGRFKQSLIVGDKDVQSAIAVNGDAPKDATSFEYQMRPIVLVVPRNSPPSVTEDRRKEAEALRSRVQSCSEAEDIFRTMQNATIRDMVVKTSADLPPPLRDMLDKTDIGKLTPPEVTQQGVEMVALCARNATTVDTPEKRAAKDKLFAAKYQAQADKYLAEVRKSSMIEYR
jgi:peptidyl-prolyl cis-trans isomerase SurA